VLAISLRLTLPFLFLLPIFALEIYCRACKFLILFDQNTISLIVL
jgi:hypothetical protein